MKYAKIENKKQYQAYCKRHLELGNIFAEGNKNKDLEDEYYVLDLIIEYYHNNKQNNNPFNQLTPVDLLKALMKENGYSGYRLSKELGISKSVFLILLTTRERIQ